MSCQEKEGGEREQTSIVELAHLQSDTPAMADFKLHRHVNWLT